MVVSKLGGWKSEFGKGIELPFVLESHFPRLKLLEGVRDNSIWLGSGIRKKRKLASSLTSPHRSSTDVNILRPESSFRREGYPD
jgi:hypothetical protein